MHGNHKKHERITNLVIFRKNRTVPKNQKGEKKEFLYSQLRFTCIRIIQAFRLNFMYLRPSFHDEQSKITRLIPISHYSYFIRSLAIRIRRIQL